MSRRRFDQAMEWMRGADVRLRQHGFDFIREHADSYVDELIAEFEREPSSELRCWLLELLAESRSDRALPTLAAALTDAEESLRLWAVRGLENLDTPQARQVLSRAEPY